MLVTFIHTIRCPCGAANRGVMVRAVRINKRSLRSVKGDVGLGMMPRRCDTCKEPLPDEVTVESTRVTDDDLERINVWRARRGWPALTQQEAN